MITTIYGDRDEATLDKREGVNEDERAREEWIEYWDGARLVHRSAHVFLKQPLGIEAALGRIR